MVHCPSVGNHQTTQIILIRSSDHAECGRACCLGVQVARGAIGLTVDFDQRLSAASVEAELSRCCTLIDVAAALGFGLVRLPGSAVQVSKRRRSPTCSSVRRRSETTVPSSV